jgi:hypothetical protein
LSGVTKALESGYSGLAGRTREVISFTRAGAGLTDPSPDPCCRLPHPWINVVENRVSQYSDLLGGDLSAGSLASQHTKHGGRRQGYYLVTNNQWSVVSGQWPVVGGQWLVLVSWFLTIDF